MEGRIFSRNGESVVITVPVIFSMNEVAGFKTVFDEMIAKGIAHFTLDFSLCEFIDSTGLGVILSIQRKCEEIRGTLQLTLVNRNVMKILELTMLHRVFEIR